MGFTQLKTALIIIIVIVALLAVDKSIEFIDRGMGKKINGISNILRWLFFGLIGVSVAFFALLYFGLPIRSLFQNPAYSFKFIGFMVVFFGIFVACYKIENAIDKNLDLTPRKREIWRGVVIIGAVFLLYWLIKLGAKAGIHWTE